MARFSRLCDLITSSLLPFIESEPSPLNKESEKQLLLSLSRVSKEIRQWWNDLDPKLDQESLANAIVVHSCPVFLEQPFDGDCKCLTNIVSIMVAFLGFDNGYVQHLAGNTLFAISNTLISFGSIWIMFVQFIWITLETAISNICRNSSSCTATDKLYEIENLSTDSRSFIALLQLRRANLSWQMVAGLLRLLRNILKFLKLDNNELLEKYIDLATPFVQNMPWDCLSKINVGEKNNGLSGLEAILPGTLLQLFCSLVGQNDLEGVENDLLERQDLFCKLCDLVPKLLSYFCNQLEADNKLISQYLRHKMLMLMIRLSFLMQWQSSQLALWLQLLKQHFQDLLYKSVSHSDVECEISLEESPFWSSFSDAVNLQIPCTQHLQRQVIFLFFKLCFVLIHISGENSQQCSCAEEPSLLNYKLPVCGDHCCHIGLLEISEWLQRCGHIEMFDRVYLLKSSTSFALSFLQLYMEEDDMLFDMLLQLLDVPFIALQGESDEKELSPAETIRCAFSSIFNPVHLFHLLLLLLHYDHLVLVDYLISKDIGVNCVQYLLRCLRVIFQSWQIFVDYTIPKNLINESYHKRQRISTDEDNLRGEEQPSSSVSFVTDEYIPRKHKSRSLSNSVNLHPFGNAKECILSLKKTLEDLHRKDLFPYNPKPLLRSFSRFQAFCKQQEITSRK
ncbi:uncharacterized protein LOC109715072 isoform X3 [Ananas comosus]|uniref:Uncharacterized protein LOC109715072 isoform X3 n=1 Tax=Ananas comosus TaxID=4615 RepID=A0A6P5FHS8_ANACO|nr:uncharacterized protein LOC109715072 isoform X3 [Ananas comosus]